MTKIIGMYSVYHEMDITNFIDTMKEFYKAAEGDSNLKRIRESRGLSQSELAEQSGIKVLRPHFLSTNPRLSDSEQEQFPIASASAFFAAE